MSKKEVKFDLLKIDDVIKNNTIYEEGGNKFQYCKDYKPDKKKEEDDNIDFPKYFAKITLNSFNYLGIVSKNLIRENFGYNCYDNGEEYFGQWKNNKRDGYGIYFYKDKGNDPIYQIYIGDFKNNSKCGEGIFFNISKIDKEEDMPIPIDFSLSVGNFDEDGFSKGTIFSIKDNKKQIYKGKVNKEGQRNDDNAEMYEDDNKIFHGIIKDNKLVKGRIIIMKEKGGKETGYYFNRKDEEGKEIDFDFDEGKNNDLNYINKLDKLINTFDYEKLKDLFISVIMIRIKANASNSFDYMKNLNYNVDIKQKLKDQYGKLFHN